MQAGSKAPATADDSSSALGIAAMCAGVLLLPVVDAISKKLTAILSPADIAALRTVVQLGFLCLAALFLRRMRRGVALSGFTALSGLLTATVALSLISGFQRMPIATTIAIFFIEPLLLTVLSGLLLGETPGRRRYIAVAVGMVGTLLILRPNFAVFGWVVLWPLAAALAFALNMIVTRTATRSASPLTFQLGASFFAALALGAVSLSGFGAATAEIPAPASLWGWPVVAVLASGALAALIFLLITFAFSRTEASVLAPFQYLEILGATVIGYVVFGESLDGLTLLGTLIVLGSGLYVFHRERQTERRISRARARPDR